MLRVFQTHWLLLAMAFLLAVPQRVASQSCVGDCDGDAEVTIDEILKGVAITLGDFPFNACRAFDRDANGSITIDELIEAVFRALSGCPTPVPTSSGTIEPTPAVSASATATRTRSATVGPSAGATVSVTASRTGTATSTPTITPLPGPRWESKRALPMPRQEHAVAELNGRIYVVGGFDDELNILTSVQFYDPLQDAWFDAAPLPQALHHVVLVAAGGRLYAIGGLRLLTFTAVNTLYEYDPAANRWERRADLLRARGAGAGAAIDGRIYLAGGLGGGLPVNDFSVYDPATNLWSDLPPMPTARDHLGAAAVNGVLYAIGGRAGQLFDTVEAYSPATGEWSTLAPMPTARGGLAVAALNGLIYAIGGEGNPADVFGVFPQTEVYDPANNRWDTLPDMPTPRHGMGAAGYGNRIFVPGGGRRANFGAVDTHEALRP